METLKEIIEEVGTQTLWAKEYEGNDVLSSHILGDGKKLIVLTMLNTRPFSHFLRVDSKFSFDDEDWETEVFETLEEEFGDYESLLDDEDCEYDEDNLPQFPIVNSSSGYTYNTIRWRDVNKKTSHKTDDDYAKAYQVCIAYGRYKKKKYLLNKNSKEYYNVFWKIIGDADIAVSIQDVLDYERKKDIVAAILLECNARYV